MLEWLRKRPVDRYRVAFGLSSVIPISEIVYQRTHSGHALLSPLMFGLWATIAGTSWFLRWRRDRRAESAPVVTPGKHS
jgi:hypothetical protein